MAEDIEDFRRMFTSAVRDWKSASSDTADACRGIIVAWSLSAVPFILVDVYRDPTSILRWDPVLREIFGRGPVPVDDVNTHVANWSAWCGEEMVPLDWRCEPSEYARRLGAKVAVPGGMLCPWCAAHCSEIVINGNRTMVARCEWNPEHVVSWVPWGG